jgi:hypothetical protein
MAENERAKTKLGGWECPNPKGAYNLGDLVFLLENDKAFAGFFSDLLKRANNNDKSAIACVDSYFQPTDTELENLGIPASNLGSLRMCTDSGLLVAVIAQQNA